MMTDGVNSRLHMRKPQHTGTAYSLDDLLSLSPAQRRLGGKLVASNDPGRISTNTHITVEVPAGLHTPFFNRTNNLWPIDHSRGVTTEEYYTRAGFNELQ